MDIGDIVSIGSGVGNFVSSLFGGSASKKQQERNWKHEKEMFNMTNEYNKPINQMARLREANLNPNLMYGQGNVGNATMPAPNPQPVREQPNFGDAIQTYVSTRKQQTDIDNIQQATQVAKADELKKQAETARALQDTARSKYDLDLAKDLRDNVVASSKLGLDLTQARIAQVENQIKNLDASTQIAVKEGLSRIKLLGKQASHQDLVNAAQQITTSLAKSGLSWNDPLAARLVALCLGTSDSPAADDFERENLEYKKTEGAIEYYRKRAGQWLWGRPKSTDREIDSLRDLYVH